MEIKSFNFTQTHFDDLAIFFGMEFAREEIIKIFEIELDGYIAYRTRRIAERAAEEQKDLENGN